MLLSALYMYRYILFSAEALGASGDSSALSMLEKYATDSCDVVRNLLAMTWIINYGINLCFMRKVKKYFAFISDR